METPIERLALLAGCGFLLGIVVAAVYDFSWLGILTFGVVVAIAAAAATHVQLALDVREERRQRPVVREPRISHVSPVQSEREHAL